MENESLVREAQESDYGEVARLIAELQQLHAAARPDLYRMPDEPLPREVYADSLRQEGHFAYVIEAAPQPAKDVSCIPRQESELEQRPDSGTGGSVQAEHEETRPNGLAAYLACRIESKMGSRALHSRTVLFIDEIVVDPSFRGSGFGRLLIETIRQRAQDLGVDALELNVFGFNENAAAFYEALGFRTKSSRLEFEIR